MQARVRVFIQRNLMTNVGVKVLFFFNENIIMTIIRSQTRTVTQIAQSYRIVKMDVPDAVIIVCGYLQDTQKGLISFCMAGIFCEYCIIDLITLMKKI